MTRIGQIYLATAQDGSHLYLPQSLVGLQGDDWEAQRPPQLPSSPAPQDQDGGSGSTGRDQDLDLKNCAEFVVVQEPWIAYPSGKTWKAGRLRRCSGGMWWLYLTGVNAIGYDWCRGRPWPLLVWVCFVTCLGFQSQCTQMVFWQKCQLGLGTTMSAHVSWLLDAAVSRKEEQTSVQVGWNHFLQRSGDAFLRRLWWGLQIEASLLVRRFGIHDLRENDSLPLYLPGTGKTMTANAIASRRKGSYLVKAGWSTRTNHHSWMKKMVGPSWSVTQGLVVVPFCHFGSIITLST